MFKNWNAGRVIRALSCFALLTVLLAPMLVRLPRNVASADQPTVDGFVPFSHWPTDRKPEAVLVLTGQTYGYLSPCGCSRPQKGGLERRANFMDSLRAKGWPVLGLDLGDITAVRRVPDQERLKYVAAMQSLKSMGYVAIGLGVYDFELQLYDLLSAFTLQKEPRPVILAANLVGKGDKELFPREKAFDAGPGQRPMVEDIEIVTRDPNGGACAPIGITSVIGKTAYLKLRTMDPQFEYLENTPVLQAALKKFDDAPVKPALRVLLYVGTLEEAKVVAEAFPQFELILCQSEEPEPPQFPTVVNNNKTFIVQVGQKGSNVGTVGIFKTATGYEMKYQMVPLGEPFVTPPDKVATHKVLNILEDYSEKVKTKNLLAKYVEKPLPHPAMIQNASANLTYVGVDKCKACHPNEAKIWGDSKHSHAYEALEKLAVNPKNRQFDGDCVSCHSIGFNYQSGFQSETLTPNLKHNGCENCHGPGSGHSASPNDKELLKAMMPWRTVPGAKMPSKEKLEALAKVKPGEPRPVELTPLEQQVFNGVSTMCMRCHDGENDPKFDLNVNFPKIYHSGFKAKAAGGLPGNAK